METRHSGFNPAKAGWNSSCPPRSPAWRTALRPLPADLPRRVRLPWRRGRRAGPRGAVAMTSAATRARALVHRRQLDDPAQARPSWTSCAATRSCPSTPTPATWRPPSSRPTATSPEPRSRFPGPDRLPAARDGRLRAAISILIATARRHDPRSIVMEDLDFAEARAEGRERSGNRPSRGRRGTAFRRALSGIRAGKLRDRSPDDCQR